VKAKVELAENILLIDDEKSDIDIEMWGDLSKYSTFKVGGKAKYVVKVSTAEQLVQAIRLFISHDIPFYILGGASNVLIDDKPWDGGVIVTKTPPTDFIYRDGLVEVFAGDYLPALIHKLASWDLAGFEFLVGVPGTVGGAIIMNAGTSKMGICDFVEKVEIVDIKGKKYVINRNEMSWGYRYCSLPLRGYIVKAWLRVIDKPAIDVLTYIREHMSWRRKHQPIDMPCAGSYFKNTPEFAAGYLIDQAGLKGYRIGGAQVSTKHANFIVNIGNATSSDILSLANYVKEAVKDKFGVLLEEEVKFISHER